MSPKIDIEKLTQTTRKALAKKEGEEEENLRTAEAKKKADEEALFQAIIASLPERMDAAAAEGKHSVDVWEMGQFGPSSAEYNIPDVPINWEFFNRLKQYCESIGLTTEKLDIPHHWDRIEHYSYRLVASWPV